MDLRWSLLEYDISATEESLVEKKKENAGTAAIVTHGIYQYVRLPKQFRFEGDRVQIGRWRNGVILTPLPEVVPKPHEAAKS